MGILFMLIIGIAAGFVATRMMNVQLGMLQTIAVGVLGALVGGIVLRMLIAAMGAAAGFLGAILGSVALIWIYQTYFAKK